MKNNKNILLIILVILIVGLLFYFIYSNNKKVNYNIVIDKTEILVKKNSTYQLNAHVENDKNALITWSSSDDNIAIVENGLINAINYGEVTITAKYKHDDKEYTKDCHVKVFDGEENTKLLSVNFPEGDLIMGINNTYELENNLVRNPENAYIESVTYTNSSSNFDIKDGTITCKSKGNSMVEITYNNSISDKINIYCMENIENPRIVLNPTSIDSTDEKIKIGETKKISYTLTPSNSSFEYLKFHSSDESIATIDESGNIKGISEGKVIVTISSINGISKNINVSVEKNFVKATSITISEENIDIDAGKTYTLIPTVLPVDATNKELSFDISDPNIISVSTSSDKKSAVIYAHKVGQATITIKNGDGIEKIVNVNVGGFILVNPKIVSTGTIDRGLLGSPTNDGYNLCRKQSPQLTLKINGTTIGQDGTVRVKVGESFNVDVYLPTKCGNILTLTRTSADGSSKWREHILQANNPHVERDNKDNYVNGVQKYRWTISAIKKGSVIASQTAQFDVRSPSGATGNIKSMIRLNVNITE